MSKQDSTTSRGAYKFSQASVIQTELLRMNDNDKYISHTDNHFFFLIIKLKK